MAGHFGGSLKYLNFGFIMSPTGKFETRREKLHKVKRATLSLTILVVGGITAVGCGSSGNGSVTVTQLAPDGVCLKGGVQIAQPGKPTQVVCNGTTGTNGGTTLVVTTPLSAGDGHCSAGGVRIDSGLDNGAGGGTANNGTLEPGEIASTQFACNGDTGTHVGSLSPPAGSDGANTLRSVGGTGTATNGGHGGDASLFFNDGSFGGNLKVFRTGTVDAGFTFPAPSAGELGDVPATVTVDTEVVSKTVNPPSPAVATGSLFSYNGNLWVQDTPTTSKQVTGISVAAGIKLTFDVNNGNTSDILVAKSCHNAGTITAKGTNILVAAALNLDCGEYLGDTGSVVTTMGTAGTTSFNGQSAGNIDVNASTGAFVNQGSFLAMGGNGQSGGTGGHIKIRPEYSAYNSGALVSRGGNSEGNSSSGAGTGGNASYIIIDGKADVYNSGSFDSSGGSGFQGGGNAGSVSLYSGECCGGVYAGSVVNSGSFTSSGGSVDATCTSGCNAGNGNSINFRVQNGALINAGMLQAMGGSAPNGQGGAGGNLDLEIADDSSYHNIDNASGNLELGASMDNSGGSGLAGGSAGGVTIQHDPYNSPKGQEIILYGFTSLDTSGGPGVTSGGNGGQIELFQSYNWNNNLGPGGAVVNYADFSSSGGNASSGFGGGAGHVLLTTQKNYYIPGPRIEVVVSAGAINASGGSGTTGAGSGNYVTLYGTDGVTSTGSISARGGNASAAAGGGANHTQIISDNGPVSNTGTIDASAGSGGGSGSSGGNAYTNLSDTDAAILLAGTTVTNSGSCSANGGNGDSTPVVGGAGGAAGSVQFLSLKGSTTNTAAATSGISVKAGTGKTLGAPGVVEIDGRFVTVNWTH